MIADLFLDALRSGVMITGLVVVMMMLIESLNIESGGAFFAGLKRSRLWQVVVSALLGSIPGCMGGFASVSLYTHGMISFGALVAMMIASSGDESFVMLAMMPQDAVWIMLLLFGIAIAVGWLTDLLFHPAPPKMICEEGFAVHGEESHDKSRHITWQRVVMFLGVAAFLTALLTGHLEHGHAHETSTVIREAAGTVSADDKIVSADDMNIYANDMNISADDKIVSADDMNIYANDMNISADDKIVSANDKFAGGTFNLLSEEWMYWLFGVLSLIVLGVLLFGSDHFVEEHLWHHITVHHLPKVFAWTFGVLLLLSFGLHFLDLSQWISDNTALMILLATLVGIIPESGPHLIFITLYASGIVPLPVLLASCISQDGHASLPLLAESKRSFLQAKLINCAAALAVGYVTMLFI